MYCVLYDHATMCSYLKKHIIAIKTIHLCPFQQELHTCRPRFFLGHDTEVAIMVLNIFIVAKIIFLIMSGGVPSICPNSGECYTHFLHGQVTVIVILLVLWTLSRFLVHRPSLKLS